MVFYVLFSLTFSLGDLWFVLWLFLYIFWLFAYAVFKFSAYLTFYGFRGSFFPTTGHPKRIHISTTSTSKCGRSIFLTRHGARFSMTAGDWGPRCNAGSAGSDCSHWAGKGRRYAESWEFWCCSCPSARSSKGKVSTKHREKVQVNRKFAAFFFCRSVSVFLFRMQIYHAEVTRTYFRVVIVYLLCWLRFRIGEQSRSRRWQRRASGVSSSIWRYDSFTFCLVLGSRRSWSWSISICSRTWLGRRSTRVSGLKLGQKVKGKTWRSAEYFKPVSLPSD